MEEEFVSGSLHPMDLKAACVVTINSLLEPIRQHFINNPEAKTLLEQVRSF